MKINCLILKEVKSMTKKLKKVLLCLLFVLFLSIGTSCVGSTEDNYLMMPAGEKYKLSYIEKNEEGYLKFLDKLNDFSSVLSEELYLTFGRKYENICVSPISIYMALALVTECANQNTRMEILNALGMSYEEVKTYTKKLFASMNNEYTSRTDSGKEQIEALELLTNSIWFEETIKLKEVGLNNLANDYNCSSYSAPFNKNNKSANKALRNFVSENTKGLIDRDFELSVDTLIALVNTLYLKEIWNSEGDELSFTNNKYTFINYDLSTKDVNLLRGYYYLGKVVEEEKYTHFFTKTDHGFKIKFIVPNDGYVIDDIYNKEILTYVNSIKDYKAVDDKAKTITSTRVLFPEYKAEFNEDIKDVIKNEFKVNDLFDYKKCNFSNIIDEEEYLDKYEGIYCSKIIHQTCLEVNKKGIEGAAVTIVAMDGVESVGPNEEYVEIFLDYIVDRSFAYILTDSNDVMLFSGVVKNI